MKFSVQSIWKNFRSFFWNFGHPSQPSAWLTSDGQLPAAGIAINEELALTYSAVFAAVRAISIIATSKIKVSRFRKDERRYLRNHPVWKLFNGQASEHISGLVFRETLIQHALLWGNGYAYIERNNFYDPISLTIIPPNCIKPFRRKEDGALMYEVKTRDGKQIIEPEDIFHVHGLGFDGTCGYSVISLARQGLSLALAMEKFGSTFFGNGATPGLIIKAPQKLNAEQQAQLRQSIEEIHQGSGKAFKTMILAGAGMDASQLGVPPEDAQFLQSRVFQLSEVSRWFGVPLHLLSELSKANYNSLESLGIEFVTYTLRRWAAVFEAEIKSKLLRTYEVGKIEVEHDFRFLLAGDTQARTAYTTAGRQQGWLSCNDIRELEGLDPVEGGDKLWVPQNMGFLEENEDIDGNITEAPNTNAVIIDLPDYRQETPYSCGAAVTRSVLSWFGIEYSEAELREKLNTTPADGTDIKDIIGLCNLEGLATQAGAMTLDDLAAFFGRGVPVICPVQAYGTPEEYAQDNSGHYVAVVGIGLGQVFLQDPVAGRINLSQDEFLQRWHDKEGGGSLDQFGIAVSAGMLAPAQPEEDETEEDKPEETNDKPEDKPEEKPQANDTERKAVWIAQNRLLSDAVGRMVRREIKAIGRASKRPDFLSWVDEWFVNHRKVFTETLSAFGAGHLADAIISDTIAELKSPEFDQIKFGETRQAGLVDRILAELP